MKWPEITLGNIEKRTRYAKDRRYLRGLFVIYRVPARQHTYRRKTGRWDSIQFRFCEPVRKGRFSRTRFDRNLPF